MLFIVIRFKLKSVTCPTALGGFKINDLPWYLMIFITQDLWDKLNFMPSRKTSFFPSRDGR